MWLQLTYFYGGEKCLVNTDHIEHIYSHQYLNPEGEKVIQTILVFDHNEVELSVKEPQEALRELVGAKRIDGGQLLRETPPSRAVTWTPRTSGRSAAAGRPDEVLYTRRDIDKAVQ